MICYLFLAWDNKVVIRAGAFIFCVGNQLSRLSERREGKALTQDSGVGIWAEALSLCFENRLAGATLNLRKNFFSYGYSPRSSRARQGSPHGGGQPKLHPRTQSRDVRRKHTPV